MKKSIQLIALVAVALLSSCGGGEKDKATAEKVDEKPRVKLASVTARPVDQIQEYTATVQAEVKNNIAPSSPVRIDQIFVEVGDRVSKGQKLVQMDAANLKQAKFRLDNQEIANASYFCHVSRKKVSNSASALFLKSSNSCCCCFAKSSNSFSMSCAHKCAADKKKATKAAEKHFILFICIIDLEKLK